MKEMRIPHADISDPNKVTQRNIEEFKRHGLDIHRHEVIELHDDHKRGERVLKVQDRKYFDLGKGNGNKR